MRHALTIIGSIALLFALWCGLAMFLGSGCGTSLSALRPAAETIEDVAAAFCAHSEQEQRSPGDVDIDAYCKNREVINAIVGTLLEAKRAARVRLAALPTAPATIGPAPSPVPAQPTGDTGDP
jgi:hypothetical protein